MGQVYLAEDTKLGRQVAIKLLPPEDSAQPQSRKRLVKEAQAAAKLDHPHVCSIFEVGESASGAYIAMQFVEGETLGDLLHSRKPSIEEVAQWGAEVADALDEAHRQGLVHRDIKPQNIMITSKGHAKVLDFGLAKDVTALPITAKSVTLLTSPGMVVGTVPYMSPEQVRGEDLDGRSDIFSLGAVLYEASTGRRPFTAKSGAELMSAILVSEPSSLLEGTSELHPELRRILKTCLAKDLGQRYATAGALRDDLGRLHHSLLNGEQYLPSKPARALPWKPVVKTVVALILVTAGAWGVNAWRKDNPSADAIAVLPFTNTAHDPQVDYLADGLAEGLIDELSRVPGLRVIAWTSSSRFKGDSPDLGRIAKQLDVKAVLVGHIIQRPDGVAVSVELANAQDGSHLWGESFTRPAQDLLSLQGSIAKGVARSLAPKAVIAATTPASPAYDLYLKGRFLAEHQTPDSFPRALELFDQAIDTDPKFALAHAGKAIAYWNASSALIPSTEAMPKTKEEAKAALALDPKLPEAHIALAQALFSYDRDYAGAEAEFEKAISLNDNSALAHEYFGYFLMIMGRQAEARKQLEMAMRLDPMSSLAQIFMGGTYFYDRNYPVAEAAFKKALALDPGHPMAEFLYAWTLDRSGNRAEAESHLTKVAAIGSPWILGYQGNRLARMGNTAEAEACLAQLKGPSLDYFRAMILEGLGRNDEAMNSLQASADAHEEEITTINVDPTWDGLRNNPRFLRIRRAAGFQ
ncbi:MAG: protein kinase [Acidobacteria bacterium]|nr:protein kinase [Acidobacteriota bacterium]